MPPYLDESKEKLIQLIMERAKSRNLKLPQPQLDLFPARSDQEQQRRAAKSLVDKVGWPSVEDLAGDVKLHLNIYDMTDHHLSQPDFVKAIEKAYQIDLATLIGGLD